VFKVFFGKITILFRRIFYLLGFKGGGDLIVVGFAAGVAGAFGGMLSRPLPDGLLDVLLGKPDDCFLDMISKI